jgi:2-methylcitrate dehydratase PrpD
MILQKGRIDTEMYNDRNFNDPEVKEIMAKVQYGPDPSLDEDYEQSKSVMSSIVEITVKDGKVFSKKLDYPKGDPENPASKEELREKFRHLATQVITPEAAEEVIDMIDRLERVQSMRDLTGLLRNLQSKP